jgi:hypothetical protein
MIVRDSSPSLIQDEIIKRIHIGFLPEGEFYYPISFSKQSKDTATVKIKILSQEKCIAEHDVRLTDKKGVIPLSFSILRTNKGWGKEIIIESPSLHAIQYSNPISPKIQSKVRTSHVNKSVADEISQEIKTYNFLKRDYKPINHSTTNEPSNTEVSLNENQLKAFFDQTYFRGLLSTDEAGKQLDYVIYHKLFTKGKANFMNRFKRRIYRRFTISIYSLLTKNSIRKIQVVKLYKNYINTNILADNYHSK